METLGSTERAIVFDLWGTLARKGIDISDGLKSMFDLGHIPDFERQYEEALQTRAWVCQHTMAEQFLTRFQLTHTPASIQQVLSVFQEGISGAELLPGMIEITRALKPRFRLGLLSNTTDIESTVTDRWRLNELFDTVMFSWQIGTLKPAPESFLTLCRAMEIEPKHTLMIDDSAPNIAQATALGMDAILFIDAQLLRTALRNRGLLQRAD